MNQKPEKNLVLIGFMGCGKSSVAAALGRHCQMEVVEMDQMIAGQQGLSIPEIFEHYGEEYFRDLETALLRSLQGRRCTPSQGKRYRNEKNRRGHPSDCYPGNHLFQNPRQRRPAQSEKPEKPGGDRRTSGTAPAEI